MNQNQTRNGPRPRVQFSRKIGHLFQVFYGLPGQGHYGYGVTRGVAGQKARAAFAKSVTRALVRKISRMSAAGGAL